MRDEIRQVLRYALIIAMLAVLVLVFSGAEGEICEKAKDTAAKDCSAHNIVLVALWQIGAFLDRWSAAIVAIATVVVAGFTGTLYRATRQLSLAAEQQKIDTAKSIRAARISAIAARRSTRVAQTSADTARRELILTQRPKLIVRDVRIEYFGDDDSEARIAYKIANVGGTPAMITDCRVDWNSLAEVNPDQILEAGLARPDDGSVTKSISPGAWTHGWFHNKNRTEALRNAVLFAGYAGTFHKRLVFYGRITYSDDLGTERTTGFYREYNPSEVRFRNTDHPDFEYND